jgi:hypothetical protein
MIRSSQRPGVRSCAALAACVLAVASVPGAGLVHAAGPAGWFLAGSAPADYNMGMDAKTFHGGKGSGFLASSAVKPTGFGTLMQQFTPHQFVGKRVRLSAWVKSERIVDWAGVWMRVDGTSGKSVAFDNMQSRPIKGTNDWTKYDVVLDVPSDAANLAFGILIAGSGEAWIDDVSFAVVDTSVATTERPKEPQPTAPANLDFEQPK